MGCCYSCDIIDNNVKKKYDPVYPTPGFVCTVCMDEDNYDELEGSPCGHVVHRKCLRRWWREQYTCPVCAMPIVDLIPEKKLSSK